MNADQMMDYYLESNGIQTDPLFNRLKADSKNRLHLTDGVKDGEVVSGLNNEIVDAINHIIAYSLYGRRSHSVDLAMKHLIKAWESLHWHGRT